MATPKAFATTASDWEASRAEHGRWRARPAEPQATPIRSARRPVRLPGWSTTTRIGCPARLSARYSITFSVSGSDHCTSSTTSSVGRSGASTTPPSVAARLRPARAWPARRRSRVSAHSGTSDTEGRQERRQLPGRAQAGPSGGRAAPPATGAAARRPPSGCTGPTKTVPARVRASAATSRTRRLLPMPAPPLTRRT